MLGVIITSNSILRSKFWPLKPHVTQYTALRNFSKNRLAVLPKQHPYNETGSYFKNTFINSARAADEFLLSENDLKNVLTYKRRSPHLDKESINVYNIHEVKKIAQKKYGTFKRMKQIRESAEDEIRRQHVIMKHLRRALSLPTETDSNEYSNMTFVERFTFFSQTFKNQGFHIITVAAFINLFNVIVKLFAWRITKSDAIFSECVHSMADTLNQLILLIGMMASLRMPTVSHPYGYRNMKHISSLMSGVAIFCLGSGLSLYHGITSIMNPTIVQNIASLWIITTFSFITESLTFWMAYKKIKSSAKKMNISFFQYIRSGIDPGCNVILFEDFASLLGMIVACSCASLSSLWNMPIIDSLGSIAVGSLLSVIAMMIIRENTSYLVGRSIPKNLRNKIINDLEGLRVVRSIHDVKAIHTSGEDFRFKAEIDFDGRELVRKYLKLSDSEKLLRETIKIESQEEKERFIIQHGSNLIDFLGAEIDRIERFIISRYPKLQHLDLEIL